MSQHLSPMRRRSRESRSDLPAGRVQPVTGGAEIIHLHQSTVECCFCHNRVTREELLTDPDIPGVVTNVCLKCYDGAGALWAAMFSV